MWSSSFRWFHRKFSIKSARSFFFFYFFFLPNSNVVVIEILSGKKKQKNKMVPDTNMTRSAFSWFSWFSSKHLRMLRQPSVAIDNLGRREGENWVPRAEKSRSSHGLGKPMAAVTFFFFPWRHCGLWFVRISSEFDEPQGVVLGKIK